MAIKQKCIDKRTFEKKMRMPRILNLEEEFARTPDAILVNRLSYTEADMSETINKHIFTTQDGNLDFVASCECGRLKSNSYLGAKCDNCNTTVKNGFLNKIVNRAWITVPDGITAFMHPTVFGVLSRWLSVGRPSAKLDNSYLDIILDASKELPDELVPVIKDRGFNYLHDNFDFLMDYFLNEHPKTKKHNSVPMIKLFLKKYRNCVFTTKLPLTNSSLHPLSKESDTLMYGDPITTLILDAIIDICTLQLTDSTVRRSMKRTNRVTYRSYSKYINYLLDIIREKLAKKKALPRAHLLGTRTHFSMRTVITPTTEEHKLWEVFIPWSMAIRTFEHQLVAVLNKHHGYTILGAYNYVSKHENRYCPIIDSIFKNAIKNYHCPWYSDLMNQDKLIDTYVGGLPALIQRNPTLGRNNILLVVISLVKSGKLGTGMIDEPSPELVDVSDRTISFPHELTRGPNADYDGDEMNLLPILEANEVHKYVAYTPWFHLMDFNSISVNKNIAFHDTKISTLNAKNRTLRFNSMPNPKTFYKGLKAC